MPELLLIDSGYNYYSAQAMWNMYGFTVTFVKSMREAINGISKKDYELIIINFEKSNEVDILMHLPAMREATYIPILIYSTAKCKLQ